jgi:hypothetical protein
MLLSLGLGLVIYTILCGFAYGVFLVLYSCVVISASWVPHEDDSAKQRRIGRKALFLAVLLVVGHVTNALWTIGIEGRLYEAVDFVGADCLPFVPISRGMIDDFGQHAPLYGVTMWQLQCVWLVFAAATWALAWYVYRRILRFFVD